MTGIYIHFPFCTRKCSYCSFFSVPYSGENTAAYLKSLHNELVGRASAGSGVSDTIYFGGGTPSLLHPENIKSTIAVIQENYRISEDAEITIEANPESLKEEQLHEYISAGVNRVSLGIQSLDVAARKKIGRNCLLPKEDLLRTIELVSKTGVNYSVDIIAGVPGQSMRDVEAEINDIHQYKPDHFSVYILSVEEGTPLYAAFRPNDSFNGEQREIFAAIMNKLKTLGYEHYEVSNYAMNGRYSRHNMKYWKFDDYLGYGPGAHSFSGGRRSWNDADIRGYCLGKTAVHVDERNVNQSIAEYFMTGLRLMRGVTESHFQEKFNQKIPETVIAVSRELERKGFLLLGRDDGLRIRISEEGIFFLDDVIFQLTEALL
jgi:oxygen-independent coproporphyrinogen III oxidase